ncbi:MAG: cob(I)yrinic acid a,c-diamide adenosyltransferase [Oligoflexia bacterium]|nr:cob(I)yrinic acid a,c-diamide adenosyltransferase [Oligoflexia bacterium]
MSVNSGSGSKSGLVIVYTGEGKGKTTAALGACYRALGYKHRCAIVQFIKGNNKTGESFFTEALTKMDYANDQIDIHIHTLGRGFVFNHDDHLKNDDDLQAAKKAWEVATNLIMFEPRYDLVVLDEITYAFKYDFLNIHDALSLFKKRHQSTSIVITGRNCPQAIIDYADLVTEMRMIKHPYEKGIAAIQGIDY